MLDAAVQAIDEGRPEAARGDHGLRARAPPRDDPLAARPLVQHRAGRAPRPGLRARPCTSWRNQLGIEHKVQIEVDVDRAARLGEKEQVGLYQIVRESLSQAVRRGPPSRISVVIRDTADGEIETVVERQRQGRAAQGDARRDRRARLDAQRPLLGRAGAGRRHGDPRRVPVLRRSPQRLDSAPTMDEHGNHGGSEYLLFVWSPSGWTLAAQRRGSVGSTSRRVGCGSASRAPPATAAAARHASCGPLACCPAGDRTAAARTRSSPH